MVQAVVLTALTASVGFGQADPSPWQFQKSGVDASLRGLCVVDTEVVWASGSRGTVLRTVDGGARWQAVSVPDAAALDFRDIHAFDARRAVVISSGTPARIYRTEDGGATWKMAFQSPHEAAFFDALSFFDPDQGLVMSDPVDDRILLVESTDGGRRWTELPGDRRPRKEQGEAGFAASGTNMRVLGDRVCIALGGAEENQTEPHSRIAVSTDRAATWSFVDAPIPRSPSAGIFSLALIDERHWVAVGGDFQKPDRRDGTAAVTFDGGATWRVPQSLPGGYRSCVASGQGGGQPILIAVGTNGTDISRDGGVTWQAMSQEGFHAVQFAPDGRSAWASGAEGRIARWSTR